MGCFNCLNPQLITDKRGVQHRVRCGHCEACTNKKALDYTTQCELESKSHKYTLFVTLTYSNENLPLVRPFNTDCFTFYNPISPRLHEHFVRMERNCFAVSSHETLKPTSLSLYYSKFALPEYLNGLIPVLDKVDLQLFIKRLRYYISKYSNEKIRYYAIGEYGPQHFRPHYHLLLWYDKPETACIMGKAIHSSWKLGRIDYQIAKGDVAQYVAAYANSISSRSRLHGIRYIRPFVLHSSSLFGSFYRDEEEALFNTTFTDLVRKSYACAGRNKFTPPTLSFENRYFGRCINYDQKNHYGRMVCFSFAATAVSEFGERPVSELAELICTRTFSRSFALMRTFTFDGTFSIETAKSVLYRSRRFLRFCRLYHVTPDEYTTLIEKYWQDKDYYNLTCQLSEQEEYSAEFGPSWLPYLLSYYDITPEPSYKGDFRPLSYSKPVMDYLASINVEPQFYTDEIFNKKDNVVYKNFASRNLQMSRDRIKHKKLNDLNNIFL